jgi:SAM-dependent methyltransferase
LCDAGGLQILDVAPQDYQGAREFFTKASVRTLDINPAAGADFTADLCIDNSAIIPGEAFDLVVCTEVLEHTLRPWDAVRELARILKSGGRLLASAPFNFRIHGPLPDCWRFTEHGWRALLGLHFRRVETFALETPSRPLMPVHYTVMAEKAGPENADLPA